MTWHFVNFHYSQAPAAESWDPCCSGGVPFALSKLIPTVEASYSSDKSTGPLNPSQSGMIYEPLTLRLGADTSTSSAGVSHAKASARQVSASGSPTHVRVLFSKCFMRLMSYGLDLCLRKTRRYYVPTVSAPYSKHLTAWGMMHNGVCWELGTSARITTGNECGLLLPTPTGAGNETSPSMQKWKGHRQLMDALKREVIPTPTAQLYGSNHGGAAGRKGKKRQSLESLTGGVFLALREWMMGVPIGWTALEPLEICRYRQWLRSHGKF